jgi:hypothetical protein
VGHSQLLAALASSVHRGPNIDPDRFDLVSIEDAAPRWHLSFAVENRIDEAIMVDRTQAREVKRGAAAGVAQFIAVAIGAAVPVNRRNSHCHHGEEPDAALPGSDEFSSGRRSASIELAAFPFSILQRSPSAEVGT